MNLSNYTAVIMKGLTFVPLMLVAYYSAIPTWINYFQSNHVLITLVSGFSLFALGFWVKRRIIGTYAVMSKSNLVLGLFVLAAASILYFITDLFLKSPALTYESLLLFSAGYILARSDWRLIRLLWPLFAILVVVPFSPLIAVVMGSVVSSLVVPLVMFMFFDLYIISSVDGTNENLRLLVLPAFIVAFGALYAWLAPGTLSFLILFIPGSLIILWIPKIGSLLQVSPVKPRRCEFHRDPTGDGFCISCGHRFSSPKNTVPSGMLGLLLTITILAMLLSVQVPLLGFNGSSVTDNMYSYMGTSSTVIPPTPTGWLINSTVPLSEPGDVYAAKLVYVPISQPETKNYTLYFELSPTTPYLIQGGWGDIQGWNRTQQPLVLGDFIGNMISYTSSNGFIFIFEGQTQWRFANGLNFEDLSVGVSFERNFTSGINDSTASSQLIQDIDSLFVPLFNTLAYHSSWDDFLYRASLTLDGLSGLVLIALSAGGILTGMYFMKGSDEKLSGFQTRSSELDDGDWSLVSILLKNGSLTTPEIESNLTICDSPKKNLEERLDFLKKTRMIQLKFIERKSEILLGWNATAN